MQTHKQARLCLSVISLVISIVISPGCSCNASQRPSAAAEAHINSYDRIFAAGGWACIGGPAWVDHS